MMRSVAVACGLLIGLVLSGCASLGCKPTAVVVEKKEERARVENRSQGMYQTSGTGRLEPVVNPGIVREYWVRSKDGQWYQVTAAQYGAAEVDQTIEICR